MNHIIGTSTQYPAFVGKMFKNRVETSMVMFILNKSKAAMIVLHTLGKVLTLNFVQNVTSGNAF